MKLIVNGETKTFDHKTLNVTQLLTLEKVEQPDTVSVQLNQLFLQKDLFATTTLNDGDEVEFLYFMGGGAL